MAEAKKADSGEGEQPAPKKKSKLLVIIVAAVVLILIIGGGAAYLLSSKKTAAHSDDEGDEAPVKEEKAKKDHSSDAPPVFAKLDAFTVKLQAEAQDAYLQATPELRVLDVHTGDKIKLYMPEIRHKILLILSGKKASDLSTPQGVQQLSNEMRVTINGIIEPTPQRKKGKMAASEPGDQAGADDPVQAVLFTSFIVQ
jgi:flagellar protein FliL